MADEQPPPVEPTRPVEPMPWDRLGGFCEDLFTVTQSVARRNLDLWSSMSQNLRKEEYVADDMTTDMARAMSSALANVQDAWDLLIRFPERERVAATAPTAFLLFTQEGGGGAWRCEDSVWMRLPTATVENYPSRALVELTGSDQDAADALKACLATELGPSRQAYRLYVTDLKAHGAAFKRGVYSGSVYLRRPPCLIANLRIVVDGGGVPQPQAQAEPPAATKSAAPTTPSDSDAGPAGSPTPPDS